MRVSAKPLSRINIRRYAQYVRHQLDLDNELFFPIVQVIESLANDEEEDFDIEIVADDEMTETYGTTNTTKNIMVIRERVYIGAVTVLKITLISTHCSVMQKMHLKGLPEQRMQNIGLYKFGFVRKKF